MPQQAISHADIATPATTRLPTERAADLLPTPDGERGCLQAWRTSLADREQAKAAELSVLGRQIAAATVKHRRQRWQAETMTAARTDSTWWPPSPARTSSEVGDGGLAWR
jgi:hypothetical protein